jgi:fumarate hydratase class II
VAKSAYIQGGSIVDVAEEMTALSREELEKLLEPVI